ncbi:OmpA family protein [Thalassomonas haliotis]|uniref:OmpA family protein n=1 Tax=Thalassomonas haliotis TaxID=485448 RepID=A0ABY7VEK9_9GAMM|nr:OmpA family protein [Thalassomonas haliotis]WDE12137.1 OmpA family protein [Thalassomonas haliotis]
MLKLSAAPIVTPLDRVHWLYQGDNFNCQLSTRVDNFGDISLAKKAGYALEIKPDSVLYHKDISNYRLGRSAAPWSRKSLPKGKWFHGYQQVNKQTKQQEKQSQRSQVTTGVTELLQALQQGVWGHINLVFADKQQVHLVLPAVSRGTSFEQFYACLTKLAPYSYEQVRDRNFYFDANEYLLSEQQQGQMKLTARYIDMAGDISKLLIDGHSDSSGSMAENLRLSQQRADDLYTHLLEAGVSPELIEVRSHGDRYPLADNSTAKGRQQNRRVNLRIIRQKVN